MVKIIFYYLYNNTLAHSTKLTNETMLVFGHQASKHLWTPVVEETLDVQLEPSNPYDSSAVAVLKDGAVIGHVPREVRRHFNQVAPRLPYFLSLAQSCSCQPRLQTI